MEGFGSSIFFPSVRQPPLPLQEFLPLQPLSEDLQPPVPLQEFWPLQACLYFAVLSSAFWSLSWPTAFMPALTLDNRLEACAALPLASNPASAAPTIRLFFDLVITILSACGSSSFTPSRRNPVPKLVLAKFF